MTGEAGDLKDGAVTREFAIVNQRGLHARAAAQLVQTVSKFTAEVTVSKDGQAVNGKSILGLMMLAAAQGNAIEVTASGADAAEAMAAILV